MSAIKWGMNLGCARVRRKGGDLGYLEFMLSPLQFLTWLPCSINMGNSGGKKRCCTRQRGELSEVEERSTSDEHHCCFHQMSETKFLDRGIFRMEFGSTVCPLIRPPGAWGF